MTYPYNNKDKRSQLTTDSVIAFLQSNPDFFQQNPELLESLNLTHGTQGNVTSLIEKQVAVLRDKNEQLQRALVSAGKLADCRQHLQQHVYSLAVELVGQQSFLGLSRLLKLSMKKWFAASQVRLFVFTRLSQAGICDVIRFTGQDYMIQDMFSGLVNRKKPLCSSLQVEHLQVLFQDEAERVKSNVVIPLISENWSGLLALGSSNWDQYGQGDELDMLVFISELVTVKLSMLLAHQLPTPE